MIFFVVTKSGFLETKNLMKSAKCSVWVGGEVLSKAELASYRAMGMDITDFSYTINADNKKELDGALNTISEHHPKERIWLECKA